MLTNTARKLAAIIGVAYALVVALVIALSVTVWLAMSRQQHVTTDLYEHPFMVSNAALDGIASMNLMRDRMLEIALASDAHKIEQLSAETYALDDKLRTSLREVQIGFLGDMTRVRRVQRMLDEWRVLRTHVINQAVRGNRQEARRLVTSEGSALFARLSEDMNYVVSFARQRAQRFVAEGNESYRQAIRQIWLLLGSTILLVILIAWVKIRTIVYVLRRDERIMGALQDSEERFRTITEFAPNGMVTIGLDGQINQVNPAMCELLGYSRNELEQMSLAAMTHPDDQSPGIGYIQDMLQGKMSSFQLEKRCLRKDGRTIWVHASFSLLRNHQGRPLYFVGQIEDVTEGRQAVQHARLMALVLDNLFDGVIIIDEADVITNCNTAAERIFGYTAREMLGAKVSLLMPTPFREQHDEYLKHYLETGEKKIIGQGREVSGKRKDGSVFPMDISVSELVTGEGRIFIGVVRDITERRLAEEEVRRLAHYDALTELPNRALLMDRLKQALGKAKRDKLSLALMFIDLDKFKPVNDGFGHDIGDLLLKEVALRLQSCLRDSDTAARVGGDEFIVLLPSMEDNGDALVVAEKILHELCQPFDISDHTLSISASIGIAVNPLRNVDEKLLLKRADIAMYYAKNGGRNRVMQYRAGMKETGQ